MKKHTLLLLFFLMPIILHNHNLLHKKIDTINSEHLFNELFFLYHAGNKEKAKQMLRTLSFSDLYKDNAIINRALLHSYENEPDKAEDLLRISLQNSNTSALIYLAALFQDTPEKYISHIDYQRIDTIPWIAYERAICSIKNNDHKGALRLLNNAVDIGFSSKDLLQEEESFKPLNDTAQFREIIRKTSNNFKKKNLLKNILLSLEQTHCPEKISGLHPSLRAASFYEKSRQHTQAAHMLNLLLSSSINFREKSISLFWMARILVKSGKSKTAREYLSKFVRHLFSKEGDRGEYSTLLRKCYRDIIKNDRYLKKL